MTWISADVDVDIDEVWQSMDERGKIDWLKEVLADGYDQEVRPAKPKIALDHDAAYRLEVISWLRANGWTVEPK